MNQESILTNQESSDILCYTQPYIVRPFVANGKCGVLTAISAVQAGLAKVGISKDRKNVQQGYAFRGIDDVYAALAPLLASNGLVILPYVISREVTERQSRDSKVLIYTVLVVDFHFVCVEDGSEYTVRTIGEAMDSGDKSTNKAMSAAYKYAAIQAFAIPTEGDNDADAVTHEVMAPAPSSNASAFISIKQQWELSDLLKQSGRNKGKFLEWLGVDSMEHITVDQVPRATAALKAAINAAQSEALIQPEESE